jgi:hypothetical protein
MIIKCTIIIPTSKKFVRNDKVAFETTNCLGPSIERLFAHSATTQRLLWFVFFLNTLYLSVSLISRGCVTCYFGKLSYKFVSSICTRHCPKPSLNYHTPLLITFNFLKWSGSARHHTLTPRGYFIQFAPIFNRFLLDSLFVSGRNCVYKYRPQWH